MKRATASYEAVARFFRKSYNTCLFRLRFSLAHCGQPFPLLLLSIRACRSCPFRHFHNTVLPLPAIISLGEISQFFSQSHSAISRALSLTYCFSFFSAITPTSQLCNNYTINTGICNKSTKSYRLCFYFVYTKYFRQG